MSGIKGKNTKPELLIRKALFAKGFRYKLHDKKLPGKPDLVFPKYKAVISIQGCFWHGHNCHLFKWPTTNEDFWKTKINRNKVVDERNRTELLNGGWRILEVWECALKGSKKLDFDNLLNLIISWLKTGTTQFSVISGEGQPG